MNLKNFFEKIEIMTASYKRLSARLFKEAGWLCILFLSCFAGGVSFGQQYQVEGKVSGTGFDLDGNPRPETEVSCEFNLCVSNCVWEMTLRLSDETVAYYRKLSSDTGRQFAMPDYDRLTFDGASLYNFRDMETAIGKYLAKMRAARTPIPAKNASLANAAVVGLEVPHDTEGDSEIWLAYASGCYFKNLTTNLLEVTWQWGFANIIGPLGPGQSVQRHATWELQPDPPQLPKSVSYLADFGNFTNAQYLAHSYTNFQNLTLPVESTLEVYRADPRIKSSTNMVLTSRYVMRAVAFKKLEKGFVFPPPVPVLTIVTDHRFNSPTDSAPAVPVPYHISNRFLTKEEAKNSDNYAKFKLNPSNSNPDSALDRYNRIRWGIVGVMAISSVIFLIIVIRKMRSARKNE